MASASSRKLLEAGAPPRGFFETCGGRIEQWSALTEGLREVDRALVDERHEAIATALLEAGADPNATHVTVDAWSGDGDTRPVLDMLVVITAAVDEAAARTARSTFDDDDDDEPGDYSRAQHARLVGIVERLLSKGADDPSARWTRRAAEWAGRPSRRRRRP